MNKKKVISLLLLAALCIGLTGCRKEPAATTVPDASQDNSISEDTKETQTPDHGSDDGIYPNATGITEVSMGVKEDLCTVKVPLNYVLAGVCYDESMQKQPMKGLSSATTTVEEAMKAGGFSTDEHMAEFSMTSLQEDETMLSAKMYLADRTPWEKFVEHYADAEAVGTDDVPGLIYHAETGSGLHLAVAIRVNDETTLELIYIGALEDELNSDELGQKLYDLVTITK